MTNVEPGKATIVVISAGVSDPSTTRLLADRLMQKTTDALARLHTVANVTTINLAPLATDTAIATIGGVQSDKLREATLALANADGIIAATPIYKAGLSGLFKSFIDILDNDLIIAKPVLLAGTAGSPRHALVIDDQMRPLFAYLRALTMPTSVVASPEDWSQPDLGVRIARAAAELAQIVRSGVTQAVANETWSSHRHEYDSVTTDRAGATGGVDLTTTLMQLAAGGSLPTRRTDASEL